MAILPGRRLGPYEILSAIGAGGMGEVITVRLKVEENQLVDVFGEIGFHIEGLKGA